jgi:hypothetical protein
VSCSWTKAMPADPRPALRPRPSGPGWAVGPFAPADRLLQRTVK